jgi:hypothetical protein
MPTISSWLASPVNFLVLVIILKSPDQERCSALVMLTWASIRVLEKNQPRRGFTTDRRNARAI